MILRRYWGQDGLAWLARMAISHLVIVFLVPFTLMLAADLRNTEGFNPMESARLVSTNLVSVFWPHLLGGVCAVLLSVSLRKKPWAVATLLLFSHLLIVLLTQVMLGQLHLLELNTLLFSVVYYSVFVALTFGLNTLWERHDAARAS